MPSLKNKSKISNYTFDRKLRKISRHSSEPPIENYQKINQVIKTSQNYCHPSKYEILSLKGSKLHWNDVWEDSNSIWVSLGYKLLLTLHLPS